MSAVVLYDSRHGTTEAVAAIVAEALGGAMLVRAFQLAPSDVRDADLVVVGVPNHRLRQSPALRQALGRMRRMGCRGKRCAVFEVGSAGLLSGLRGRLVGAALRRMGLAAATAPETFTVAGSRGTLDDGEAERARSWAERLAEAESTA